MIEDTHPRPGSVANRSDEPHSRVAISCMPIPLGAPGWVSVIQNRRTVSRNRSFHSLNGMPNPPVLHPCGPRSQGSMMSFRLPSSRSERNAYRNG